MVGTLTSDSFYGKQTAHLSLSFAKNSDNNGIRFLAKKLLNAKRQTVNLLVESSNLSFPAILLKTGTSVNSKVPFLFLLKILQEYKNPLSAARRVTDIEKFLSDRNVQQIESLSSEKPKNYDPLKPQNPPYIMGIDPGITGAISVVDIEKLSVVACFDFPIEKDSKGRKRIDVLRTAFILDAYAPLTRLCLIEEVGFQKGKESSHSQFVFGFASGEVHGILATLQIPTAKVKPMIWKMDLGLSSDKTESIERAKRLFPDQAPKFLKFKKDHGRAEAMLLAWYAIKKLGGLQ